MIIAVICLLLLEVLVAFPYSKAHLDLLHSLKAGANLAFRASIPKDPKGLCLRCTYPLS